MPQTSAFRLVPSACISNHSYSLAYCSAPLLNLWSITSRCAVVDDRAESFDVDVDVEGRKETFVIGDTSDPATSEQRG